MMMFRTLRRTAADRPGLARNGLEPEPLRPGAHLPVAPSKNSLGTMDLQHVAETVVALYNLAPPLAQTAARMENHAREQAATVGAVTRKTDAITQTLESVIQQLEASAQEALSSLRLMNEITQIAKIVAINAAIEAARAGAAGRPFGVIATEMQRLAQQTEQTSSRVSQQLQNIEAKVSDVVRVVGKQTQLAGLSQGAGSSEASSVAAVTGAFHAIDAHADQQEHEAQQVHAMSEQTRSLSEQLLLEVGKLRFGIHARSQQALTTLARHPELRTPQRSHMEPVLVKGIQNYGFFDLLYVTDAAGIQITRNIGQDAANPEAGKAAFGTDWSQRPWYLSAIRQQGPVVSDLYLSVTTKHFCFTVSEAVRDSAGQILCVLGADVNFEKLLQMR